MIDPRLIYIPKVAPAAGFWLNLSTVKMIADLSEKQLTLCIWFVDGNHTTIHGEQANSLLESLSRYYGGKVPQQTAQN